MTDQDTATFQLSTDAAETYEAKFVPAIFGQWAPRLLDDVGVAPGDDVLDVACGTGIVARSAAELVGPRGSVVGVDLNEAMLAVGARLAPDIDWRHGDAAALPVADDAFDVVVCQMAFMFFPEPDSALREMVRAARPGGRVAILVPAVLVDQPAYRRFVDLATAELGPDARPLLDAYWRCGDLDVLQQWFDTAGLTGIESSTRHGTARFDSPEDMVVTEIMGSPLGATAGSAAIERLGRAVRTAMSEWLAPDGSFEIPLVCHVVLGRA